ncbi:hypothetical protein [Legionella shakespearei]|uniref:Uncharacterized protein n=1 Tax=Legionella shakespearei DSM 23087 TaxID=1122169 RepID=A0A0W0Z726_9GAMM|nr:hypothetical protein [Legionella shakespearei]KTD64930.1 hypothetical protein Lsha_0299 [Legionella shakespearei DSM 23087]
MPEKKTFKGGVDLKFLPQAEFESLENRAPEEHNAITVCNALRLLMMGWSSSWSQLFSLNNLKAVFIKRDPELLKEFRLAFQQGFEHLFTQLDGKQFNEEQMEQIQIYLSNCMSLLPYSDLTPYESIKIPQYTGNKWEFVEFSVTPIELTSHARGKPRDHDRVFAYGLEPVSNPNARSQLIFMGTTYPAGQGFVPQVKTDLEAFETVGTSLYVSGRTKIREWLLEQNYKVNVCGVSLGGSLSLLLAMDFGDLLHRVDAMNPAGLHEYLNQSPYDRWDDLQFKPRVVVQQQGNDPVSLFGIWKLDWDLLWIEPPEEKRGPFFFLDHIMNCAGFADTSFSHLSPEDENSKRKARNFWLYSLARSAIYYLGIIPITYVIRPAVLFTLDHKLIVIPLVLAALGASVLAILGALSLISPVFALTATACLLLGGALLATPALITAIFQSDKEQDKEYAELHDPKLPRNQEMDIYNVDNKIEVDLTYKELNNYYKAIRCVLKDKEFLPEEEDKAEKRDLLVASENPDNAEQVITLQKTKAKAIHIKRTLTFIDQIGIENEDKLKTCLERDYQRYSLGKH